MIMIIIAKNTNKGFTIIETIVVLTLFSMIIVSVVAVFISVLRVQRVSFANQGLHESARNFLETITKDIKWNYVYNGNGWSGSSLKLCVYDELDYSYKKTEYKLENEALIKIVADSYFYFTPPDISVDEINFTVYENTNPGGEFSAVKVEISGKFSLVSEKSEFGNVGYEFQTAVASTYNDPINPCQ